MPETADSTLTEAIIRYEKAEHRFKQLEALARQAEIREGRAFRRVADAIKALDPDGSRNAVAVVHGSRVYVSTLVAMPDDRALDIADLVSIPE